MPQLDRVVCHTLQLEFGVRTSSLGKQYKREMVPVCKNVDIAEKQQKKNKNELWDFEIESLPKSSGSQETTL